VRFLGPKSWNEIRKEALAHSFYLQTSAVEGMALSVVEAMQLGLVPVVTGVGEIGRYCTDGQNCVLVDDDECAVKRICELLASRTPYQTLAMNARCYWVKQPLYRDSVLAACRELVRSTD
jgi:glycosyltransferase involved in cell wall biosynthesis